MTGRTQKKTNYFNTSKFNLSTEGYKAAHPLHNKSFIDLKTDVFGSGELMFRIFKFDFSLKC